MASTYYHDVYLPARDIEITVEYSRTPFDPGVSWGPAESCYPAEGGDIEIVDAWIKGSEIDALLSSDEEEFVIGELQKIPESEYDYDDPDYWRG